MYVSNILLTNNIQFLYKLDSTGVFQVYESSEHLEDEKPIYQPPSVRDYFMDLDYILGIISDGPAKSFAYRRLRYLESKWNLYTLLNEYQELADSKVCSLIHHGNMVHI